MNDFIKINIEFRPSPPYKLVAGRDNLEVSLFYPLYRIS